MLERYATSDLRISIVYRARCFVDEAEASRYAALPQEEMMTLESILTTLKKGLVDRGVVTAEKVELYGKRHYPVQLLCATKAAPVDC